MSEFGDITLKQACEEFIEHLRAKGKSERTIYTYSKDLEQVRAYFGEGKLVANILPPHVAGFLKSDKLRMMDSGGTQSERAKPTIDKTIRVFKMLMSWARESGHAVRVG